MIAFILGVTTILIIFILILYHLHQFTEDSEFQALLDEKNVFHFKHQSNKKEFESFKRKIPLTDETIKWINTIFSQIFSHFRGDSDNSDVESLNKALTNKLPPGFSFKLDSIGKDIIISKPELFCVQESKEKNNGLSSNEEILQISIPFMYNGLSFTIFSQIDEKNKDNNFIQIPLFEFDFRRIEATIRASFEIQNTKIDEDSNNDFNLNLTIELDGDNNVLDFDSSLILNDKKFTVTNCPILGNLIKKILLYLIIKRNLNFIISSSMINFEVFRSFIEEQNVIQAELNLM